MSKQTIEMTQYLSSESYQVIKDESLAFLVIAHQLLSGSCISQSCYQQVVFSDCSFHACEFQGVIFENCVFEDCSFEFSHFRSSQFKNCNFCNCTWKASSSTRSKFINCDLGSLKAKVDHIANAILKPRDEHTTDIYFNPALAA